MYVMFDLLPVVEHTGDSDVHGPRSYYYLNDPPIQFVCWGMKWDEFKKGDVFDSNWGVGDYRGVCKKLTLRSMLARGTKVGSDVALLSELLNEATQGRNKPPLIVYLRDDEQAIFETVKSFYAGFTDAQLVRMLIRNFKPPK